ncbi:unnamed protein product, partial [Chrysoparadoxa australica]
MLRAKKPVAVGGLSESRAQIMRLTGFSTEEVELIETMFQFYDADGDGFLDEEQASTLCKVLGYHPCESVLRDSDDAGRLDFHTFLRCTGFIKNRIFPRDKHGAALHFSRMMQTKIGAPMSADEMHQFFSNIGLE